MAAAAAPANASGDVELGDVWQEQPPPSIVPRSLASAASGPASGAASTHMPTVPSFLLHSLPGGQLLVPFTTRQPGTQVFEPSSQMFPCGQSLSSSQPEQTPSLQRSLRHSPFAAQGSPLGFPHFASPEKQIAERHFVGPSHARPLRRPQRSSSSSHTEDRHARWPFGVVHSPSIGGMVGSGSLFGVFGMQTFCAHHSVFLHCESSVQAAPQRPAATLQAGPA